MPSRARRPVAPETRFDRLQHGLQVRGVLLDVQVTQALDGESKNAPATTIRWTCDGSRADLHTLIPEGEPRVRAVIERWCLRWPELD
jgi:hypothetical protein